VVVVFDPTKASTVPAKETAEKVGRFAWLFLALLLLLWLPSVRLFQIYTTERPKPFGSFVWEAIGVGFLWALVNGFMSLLSLNAAVFLALPLSSLVIYFWLNREGERSPKYWHCLTFSLLFGFSVAMLSLLLRETLLAVIGV
jgi:hypothetical protein